MKRILVLLGSCSLLAAGLFGVGQTVKVTPQTLDSWQICGAAASSLADQSELTLPVGAQLSCSFAQGVVAVHLRSQPFFGTDPAGCPTLEVGPGSLAFTRDNNAGKLVLIIGNGMPMALPVPIPLGENGRSAQPLDITLGFDSMRGLVTVTIPGQSLAPVSGSASGSTVEVAVTAGTNTDWPLGSFDVVLATPDSPSASGDGATTSASQKSGSALGDKGSDAPVSAATLQRSGASHVVLATGGPDAIAASQSLPAATAHASFEVFTPPSVRWRPAQLPSAEPSRTASGK